MSTAVFLAALFLTSVWFEMSGHGPRFRAWVEKTTYHWITGKKD